MWNNDEPKQLNNEDFAHVHTLPPVLMNTTARPTTKSGQVHHITMRPKSFPGWNHDTLFETYYQTKKGGLFPVTVHSRACFHRSRTIVRDEDGRPCAVVVKHSTLYPETFKIYVFSPYMAGQKPSKSLNCAEGWPLYLWGAIVCGTLSPSPNTTPLPYFSLEMVDGTRYGARCTDRVLGGNHQYTVTRNGKVCAEIHQSRCMVGYKSQSWNLTIGPGIDPSLMITLTSIMNEMVVEI
jgi:hypothetical protein